MDKDRDRDKSKSTKPTASSSARKGTPGNSQRNLTTRSDINALIAGSPGPVSNPSEARKWLETKGWILNGENYNRTKVVDILLTTSLLPKIPPETANAVRAAAFLLEDDITDKISSAICWDNVTARTSKSQLLYKDDHIRTIYLEQVTIRYKSMCMRDNIITHVSASIRRWDTSETTRNISKNGLCN